VEKNTRQFMSGGESFQGASAIRKAVPVTAEPTQELVLSLLAARRGHFLLESGHHGELWLNLELLYRRPRRVEPLCSELVRRIASLSIDAVCGPLIEGAFVALTVAPELNLEYSYAEHFARPSSDGLFPAGYRIPEALRESVRGKRWRS